MSRDEIKKNLEDIQADALLGIKMNTQVWACLGWSSSSPPFPPGLCYPLAHPTFPSGSDRCMASSCPSFPFQALMLHNLDVPGGVANGSRGLVVGWDTIGNYIRQMVEDGKLRNLE